MNRWKKSVIAALLGTSASFAQPAPKPTPGPSIAVDVDVQMADEQIKVAQEVLSKLDMKLQAKIPDLTAMTTNMAMLRGAQDALFLQGRRITVRGNSAYDAGSRALDDRRYDEAVNRFTSVIDSKDPRADGALYWRAYALNRLGRRDDALASLAALRRDYPNSHWLNDAQVLEAEVRRGSGQAVSPADESNEELKLMAINGLMNADPDRAMPLIEGVLKGNSTPRVKDRAMFVLTQNRSARAQQILSDYAKGAGNPDLQLRAIRYIGMSGTNEAQQQLTAIYASSNDAAVKREVIRGLMNGRGRDALFSVAKNEKDEELRGEAIRELGSLRATDQLAQLYTSDA
jgi:tetratricopeptide (TPR) repeat protein